ncbi:MAG TPA: cupredoxin domain-containing protein [Solirubrobacteraceae bacterium]|nr:cupredoxin domain-containing protein [Solirubrobacteraceae bacterium]
MRSRPLLLVALSAALVAGCGGDDEEPAAPAKPAGGGDIVAVTIKDILFKPENVTARVGQTVRWTNEDSVEHDVKAESGASFASKRLSEGDTYEQKITKAGRIDYVCTIHPGQKGSISGVIEA